MAILFVIMLKKEDYIINGCGIKRNCLSRELKKVDMEKE